jgi:two-component system chemotaxis response regulator CheB
MGASTGGPAAITEILARLAKPYPLPILIVQHIATGFLSGMAGWLGEAVGMTVLIASDGEFPKPGQVYLAPDSLHMTLGKDGRIHLVDDLPDAGLRPSVARLFASTAEAFGSRSIGVLLSGMGQDGAEGLGFMRARGAETIAQDEESSVVFGMPGEAVRRKAACHVLPPQAIADLLCALAQ